MAIELEWALRDKGSWEKWFSHFFDPVVIQRGLGSFFLANEEESVIGFCYCAVRKWRIPIGTIGLAVHRNYRRRKAGTALVRRVTDWAKSAKLRALVGDVWSPNVASQAFFGANGFLEENRWVEDFKGKPREKIRFVKFLRES